MPDNGIETTKDSDVTVLIFRNGKIINANGGVMQGMGAYLGQGMLGLMNLGDK